MRINYAVELLLPAVTASLGVIGKDIDVTVKRDKDGYPIFNGKHIKGILRERVYQFKRALGLELYHNLYLIMSFYQEIMFL